jgi:hypothetical protein
MVKLGGQEHRLPLLILKLPARHAEHRGACASACNLIRVSRMPRPCGSEARLPSRVRKDFWRVTQFFDLVDDAPFEPIQVFWQPMVGRQTNIYAARNRQNASLSQTNSGLY